MSSPMNDADECTSSSSSSSPHSSSSSSSIHTRSVKRLLDQWDIQKRSKIEKEKEDKISNLVGCNEHSIRQHAWIIVGSFLLGHELLYLYRTCTTLKTLFLATPKIWKRISLSMYDNAQSIIIRITPAANKECLNNTLFSYTFPNDESVSYVYIEDVNKKYLFSPTQTREYLEGWNLLFLKTPWTKYITSLSIDSVNNWDHINIPPDYWNNMFPNVTHVRCYTSRSFYQWIVSSVNTKITHLSTFMSLCDRSNSLQDELKTSCPLLQELAVVTNYTFDIMDQKNTKELTNHPNLTSLNLRFGLFHNQETLTLLTTHTFVLNQLQHLYIHFYIDIDKKLFRTLLKLTHTSTTLQTLKCLNCITEYTSTDALERVTEPVFTINVGTNIQCTLSIDLLIHQHNNQQKIQLEWQKKKGLVPDCKVSILMETNTHYFIPTHFRTHMTYFEIKTYHEQMDETNVILLEDTTSDCPLTCLKTFICKTPYIGSLMNINQFAISGLTSLCLKQCDYSLQNINAFKNCVHLTDLSLIDLFEHSSYPHETGMGGNKMCFVDHYLEFVQSFPALKKLKWIETSIHGACRYTYVLPSQWIHLFDKLTHVVLSRYHPVFQFLHGLSYTRYHQPFFYTPPLATWIQEYSIDCLSCRFNINNYSGDASKNESDILNEPFRDLHYYHHCFCDHNRDQWILRDTKTADIISFETKEPQYILNHCYLKENLLQRRQFINIILKSKTLIHLEIQMHYLKEEHVPENKDDDDEEEEKNTDTTYHENNKTYPHIPPCHTLSAFTKKQWSVIYNHLEKNRLQMNGNLYV